MNNKWFEKVKRDRLDEEDAIMDCWKVVDDINFLWVQIMDGPEMDHDEICNILLGMQQLYDRKFQELEITHAQAHNLNSDKTYGSYDLYDGIHDESYV
jgi:uncharacterized protein YeeX (DUF496 family)